MNTYETTAPVTPRSYSEAVGSGEWNMGNLRCLVLLPILYESASTLHVDDWSCEAEAMQAELENGTVSFLQDWKGYEVILPTVNLQTNKQTFVEMLNFTRQLYKWQSTRESNEDFPPPELCQVVRKIGEDYHADGIIVMRCLNRYADIFDVTTNLMIIGMHRFYSKIGFHVDVAVYEVVSGQIAWSSRGKPSLDILRTPEEARMIPRQIFKEIENARPSVLTK
ncbi:hypothetical protein ACFL1G_10625 [Planctomycetota bacterium]